MDNNTILHYLFLFDRFLIYYDFSNHPVVLFAELSLCKCCNSSTIPEPATRKQATHGQYQNNCKHGLTLKKVNETSKLIRQGHLNSRLNILPRVNIHKQQYGLHSDHVDAFTVKTRNFQHFQVRYTQHNQGHEKSERV